MEPFPGELQAPELSSECQSSLGGAQEASLTREAGHTKVTTRLTGSLVDSWKGLCHALGLGPLICQACRGRLGWIVLVGAKENSTTKRLQDFDAFKGGSSTFNARVEGFE